jgi:serine/threonine-protein kinase RsbW
MHLSVAVDLPPKTWTLAASRRLVGELLDRVAVAVTIREDMAIAVTEACSNVVRHAPGVASYRLTVDVDDDRCVIEVRDTGPGFDPDLPRTTTADGGRGLVLMLALVDDLRLERQHPGMNVTMVKMLRPGIDHVPYIDAASPHHLGGTSPSAER